MGAVVPRAIETQTGAELIDPIAEQASKETLSTSVRPSMLTPERLSVSNDPGKLTWAVRR
jgi:hypothetical protein